MVKPIEFDIPFAFRVFQLLTLLFLWKNQKLFKVNHASLILYMLTIQTLLNIYTFFSCYFLGRPVEDYDQFIINIVYLFISLFLILKFYLDITENRFKKFQRLLVLLFWGIAVYVIFQYSFESLKTFRIELFLISVFLIFLSITNFFLNFIERPDVISVVDYLPFWISIALFIVFIGVIPVLILGEHMSKDLYYIFYYGMQFLGYFILIYGILIINQRNARRV